MTSSYGNNFKVQLFGESHQKIIGCVIDSGISGIRLNIEKINQKLEKRKNKSLISSTTRDEKDEFEIVSGYYNGKTTGAPITIIMKNKDVNSKDYSNLNEVFRPSHSDYTSYLKFSTNSDRRGGGHFSGRLTAPLVIAGEIANQILQNKYDILFLSHIKSLGNIEDRKFEKNDFNQNTYSRLQESNLPLLDESIKNDMIRALKYAKETNDSIGGKIEISIVNYPGGIGGGFFEGLDSSISKMIFSIPGVKSIEFGNTDISKMSGSMANDEYEYDSLGNINFISNNCGGILGGISTGDKIIFTVGIKPVSSISKTQKSVNFVKKENTTLTITGRHDSSIVPRVLQVIESSTAIVLLDELMSEKGREFFHEREEKYG